jgi:NitT/TauT family transport system substrate-binding protein
MAGGAGHREITIMSVRHGLTLLAAVAVVSLAAMAAPGTAQEPVVLRSPISGAGTSSIMLRYIAAKGLDKKHGIALDASKTYESLVTYYQDFFQGNHDVAIGTWDTFAARRLVGAPVQMVGTFTRANIASIVVRTDSGITSVHELKGKLFAVPTGTGTYRVSKLFLKKFYNLELEKDIPILNVPGATQGPTYVGARRADAALSWEPAISIAMYRTKNMRVLTTMDKIFRDNTGHDLFYFIIAMHGDTLKATPGLAGRVVAMFRDAAHEFEANPAEALTLAARTLEIDREAMLDGLRNNRLSFDVRPAGDPAVAKAMRVQMDFLSDNGALDRKVPAEFLYTGP